MLQNHSEECLKLIAGPVRAVPAENLPIDIVCKVLTKKAEHDLPHKLPNKTKIVATTNTMLNNRPDWQPLTYSQVCNAQSQTKNVNSNPNRIQPVSEPAPVPVILLIQENKVPGKTAGTDSHFNQKQVVSKYRTVIVIPVKSPEAANQLDKRPPVLTPKPVVMIPTQLNQLKICCQPQVRIQPLVETKVQQTSPKTDDSILPRIHNIKLVKPMIMATTGNQKPILRVTVCKQYSDVPLPTGSEPFHTLYLQHHKKDINVNDILCIGEDRTDSTNKIEEIKTNPIYKTIASDKATIARQQISKSKAKDGVPLPTAKFTPAMKDTQDHVFENPPINQYFHSKVRQKQRKRRKQTKVKKIHRLPSRSSKIVNDNFEPRKWHSPLANGSEDEYETIIREVREMKEKMQNAKSSRVEIHVVAKQELVDDIYHKENEIFEEINDGEIIGEIDDENNEIIGEIEEQSIHMDFETDAHSLSFKDEFLELGLINE